MPTPVKVPATVVEIVEHAQDLRTFVLALKTVAPRFRPGQFLHLAIDAYDPSRHWPDSRVFSIASPPTLRDRLRITVSRKGAFTSRMFLELKPGSEVWVKLPYGSFCPRSEPGSSTILLAGGSGITPFVSFLEDAADRRAAVGEIQVHYAARDRALLIYRRQLERCRDRLPSLHVALYAEVLSLSDPEVTPGRIQVGEIWNSLDAPSRATFYLSGPKGMVEAHREHLQQLGASPARLVTDEWS